MLCLTSDCLNQEETKICLSEYIECNTEDGSTPNVRLNIYVGTYSQKKKQTHPSENSMGI